MISIDRKVSRDILKITTQYNDSILFDPTIGGFCKWRGTHPDKAEQIASVPVSEIPGALRRPEERGMIKKIQGLMGDGMIFRITPELLHAKAFWWDRFTKTYVAGFVSGVLTTVVSGLLLHFLTGLF